MPRNKSRLQLALYNRPKHPNSYHYALFIASKSDQGLITKHHVKNTLYVDDAGVMTQPWRYEQTIIPDVASESRLLVRVIIAKVTQTREHVEKMLQNMPIYQVEDVDQARVQSFSCQTWVRDAFHELTRQGAVVSKLERWEDVQREAVEYLDRKREQKRWDASWRGGPGVPLMDLLAGKEIIE